VTDLSFKKRKHRNLKLELEQEDQREERRVDGENLSEESKVKRSLSEK
jgi:hypothetical protein